MRDLDSPARPHGVAPMEGEQTGPPGQAQGQPPSVRRRGAEPRTTLFQVYQEAKRGDSLMILLQVHLQ